MFLNLKNGGFSMPPHIFLTRDTTLAQIQAAFPDRETHDVGTGWYWFALPETEYRGRRFLISLAFCGQTLKSIRFAMADRNAASWEDWSEATNWKASASTAAGWPKKSAAPANSTGAAAARTTIPKAASAKCLSATPEHGKRPSEKGVFTLSDGL